MKVIPHYLLAILMGAMLACSSTDSEQDKASVSTQEWVSLFNGKDLSGWVPKIRGYDVGVNAKNTFVVDEGLLKVSYSEYDSFRHEFGHLFYEKPFESYWLRLEYRVVGEQLPDGPGWGYKNSGIMIHSPAPETMGMDQDFPISIEVQLLGGDGETPRSTGNLCTPGTQVFLADTLYTPHCIASQSPTFHDDSWVKAEIHVYSDSLVQHFINGEEVLRYTQLQMGGGNVSGHTMEIEEGKPLKGGYISLQSESHPVEFRNIEIMKW